jgi:hypothetical protein
MKIRKDITGERFGRLVAIKVSHKVGPKTYWWCRCDCGKEKPVQLSKLTTEWTRSCGCYHRERMVQAATKHGHGGTAKGGKKSPEYTTYFNILNRCYNKADDAYADYGGRGIIVCDRWLGDDGFVNFLADMGRKPAPRHSAGRKDNDGPYSKENCEWQTKMQQAQNTRATVNITWRGRTQCRAAWARELGLTEAAITYRLKHGWTVEEAFSTPPLSGLQPSQDKPEAAGCMNQGAVLRAPEWELTG